MDAGKRRYLYLRSSAFIGGFSVFLSVCICVYLWFIFLFKVKNS